MKFIYPYKVYMLGLLIHVIILIYGGFVIFQVTLLEGNSFIYAVIYLFVAFIVVHWFVVHFLKYKRKHIFINSSMIKFVDHQKITTLKKEEIEIIVEANHLQFIKVFHVVHIFAKGRYFYITDELLQFEDFKDRLQFWYGDHYMKRKKIIYGFPKTTKYNLLYR